MNQVVEFEAALMIALQEEEPLKMRMILEGMGMPVDAQDEIIKIAQQIPADDFQGLGEIIERHGVSAVSERLLR